MGSAEGLSPFAGSLRVSLRYNFFSSSLERTPEGWSQGFSSSLLGVDCGLLAPMAPAVYRWQRTQQEGPP